MRVHCCFGNCHNHQRTWETFLKMDWSEMTNVLAFLWKISSTSERSTFHKLFTYIFAQGCEWFTIVGAETEPRAERIRVLSLATSTIIAFGGKNNKAWSKWVSKYSRKFAFLWHNFFLVFFSRLLRLLFKMYSSFLSQLVENLIISLSYLLYCIPHFLQYAFSIFVWEI